VSEINRNTSQKQNIAQITKGGGIVFIGRLVSLILSYLLSVTLAQGLGVTEYGVYVVGFSVVSLIGAIALMGLNRGTVRFISMYQGMQSPQQVMGVFKWSLSAVLVTSLLAALAIIIFAVPLTHILNIPERYTSALYGFAAWIVIYAFIHQLTATIDALKKFTYRAILFDIGWPLARLLLSVGVLYLGSQLLGVIAANVLASILTLLLLAYVVYKVLYQPNRGIKSIFSASEILKFSLPVMLFNLLSLSQNQLGVYLLTILHNPDMAGVFNVAARTSVLIVAFLEGVGIIFSPFVSDLSNKGEHEELESLFSTITRWSFMLSLPASLFLILFSNPIISLFGEGFESAGPALIILALGQLINAATGPVGIVLTMSGHPNVNMLNSIITLILSLALGLVLIPRYGVVGAAISATISISGVNILRAIQVFRILKIRAYNRQFFKPLIAAVAAVMAMLLIITFGSTLPNLLFLLVGGASLGIIYSLIIWRLGLEETDQFVLEILRNNTLAKLPMYGNKQK
jgi:O-antigen/teichoic acid export membrane protein